MAGPKNATLLCGPFQRADSLSPVKSARPSFPGSQTSFLGFAGTATYLPGKALCSPPDPAGNQDRFSRDQRGHSRPSGQAGRSPSGVLTLVDVMPEGSLLFLPVHPLSGYAGGIFLDKLFFFFNIAQSMDCNKIFQAPLSDPKGEADALTHSKKSLFQIYMYSKPLEFFFHQLLFLFFFFFFTIFL